MAKNNEISDRHKIVDVFNVYIWIFKMNKENKIEVKLILLVSI